MLGLNYYHNSKKKSNKNFMEDYIGVKLNYINLKSINLNVNWS